MKSTMKISIALAAGAGTIIGGTLALTDWRPFADTAARQALERRIHDLQDELGIKLPKVWQIGTNSGP